jgi:hypothetical protein
MLLIMVIQMYIIQNLGAKFIFQLLTLNALQLIQTSAIISAYMMEVALALTCQEEAPHAIRLLISE